MLWARIMLKKPKEWANGFVTPFIDNLHRPSKTDLLVAVAVFFFACIALVSLTTDTVNNGDSAVYLQQMQQGDFARRTVHLGYYILGAGFIRLVPGPDDYVINLMNCLLGAVSVTSVCLITRMLTKHRLASLAAAAFLLTHHMFCMNSVYAEVYTPQAAFFLVAFFCWLLNRPIIAGIAFAVSSLITPSALFALPLFLITRPRLRSLLLFAAAACTLSAVVVAPVYNDYLFGHRGLLKASGKDVNLLWALAKEGREALDNFILCLPFIAIGLYKLFSRRRFLPLGLALLTLWLATLCFGERFRGVPVQLPLYTLLCVAAGLGIQSLIDAGHSKNPIRWVAWPILILLAGAAILIKTTGAANQAFAIIPTWLVIALTASAVLLPLVFSLAIFRRLPGLPAVIAAIILVLLTNGFTTAGKTMQTSHKYAAYRKAVLQIPQIADSCHLVIGDWCHGTRYAHYLSQNDQPSDWLNYEWLFGWWGDEEKQKARQQLSNAMRQRCQIWLLRQHSALFDLLQRNGYSIEPRRSLYLAVPR